jgi:hypothetical protein
MKTCNTCHTEKLIDAFHKNAASPDGHANICKECMNARQRAYRKSAVFNSESAREKRHAYYVANKEHIARKKVDRHKEAPHLRRSMVLRKKFGISIEEYEAMLAEQNGVCAICKQPERALNGYTKEVASMPVDHDHGTGKVRGLLCSHCNRALGLFQDNIKILNSAINYLERNAHDN